LHVCTGVLLFANLILGSIFKHCIVLGGYPSPSSRQSINLSLSINHWFIQMGDKPQQLNTVDNKIATIKRKIMNA